MLLPTIFPKSQEVIVPNLLQDGITTPTEIGPMHGKGGLGTCYHVVWIKLAIVILKIVILPIPILVNKVGGIVFKIFRIGLVR